MVGLGGGRLSLDRGPNRRLPAPGFACPRGRSYLGRPRLVSHFQGALLLGLALVMSFKDRDAPVFQRGRDSSDCT
jgi:hypothetical protein